MEKSRLQPAFYALPLDTFLCPRFAVHFHVPDLIFPVQAADSKVRPALSTSQKDFQAMVYDDLG